MKLQCTKIKKCLNSQLTICVSLAFKFYLLLFFGNCYCCLSCKFTK